MNTRIDARFLSRAVTPATAGRHPASGAATRFGLSVLLVAAAAFGTVAQAHPEGGQGRGMGPMPMAMGAQGGGMGMGMGFMGGRGLERLLDGVQATDAQRTQIRQIADAARADLGSQREAGRALRERAMKAFTQPTVDAREVETVRQAMLAQHDAGSRRMSQAMLEIAQVLTPTQRTQLGEQMKARSERWNQRQEERQRPGAPQS